jgi:hypothetical protein
MTEHSKRYGTSSRGASFADVSQAADAMLRSGERPTVEKVRFKIGGGSPNTLGPLLDRWWTTLSKRLDAGPPAFHRLPESVAHITEALWVQALEEARQRAGLELSSMERSKEQEKAQLEIRSYVLSLREGELQARLDARDRRIADLELTVREERRNTAKARAQAESLARQLEVLQIESTRKTRRRVSSSATPSPRRPSPSKKLIKRRKARMSGRVR